VNVAKYVYLRLERVEGYEDVASELLIEDARCHPDFNPVDVTTEFERLEAGARAVAKRCAEVCEEAAAKLRDRKRVPQVDEHVACVLDDKAAAIRAEFGLPDTKTKEE
jgi:hypothetical protein